MFLILVHHVLWRFDPIGLNGSTRFSLLKHTYEFRKNLFNAPDGGVSIYVNLQHLEDRPNLSKGGVGTIVDAFYKALLAENTRVRKEDPNYKNTPSRPTNITETRMGNAEWILLSVGGDYAYIKAIDEETLLEIGFDVWAFNAERRAETKAVKKRIMQSIVIDIR